MPNLLAIIAKAQFEAAHPKASEGDALGYDRYVSTHAALAGLKEGGSLFLVTVRPPDERLWLLGELVDPSHDGKAWKSAPSKLAVRDITAAIPSLEFANGKGLSPKKGALGMSLQTPRQLTDDDVALLRGGTAGPPKPAAAPVRQAPAESVVAEAPEPASPSLSLFEVLNEWRATRAPELEALIEVLSKHHVRAWPELDPTAADYDAQWNARAGQLCPENLPTLLPGLWSDPRGAIPMRVRKLVDARPDPRLGEALLTMIDDPPLTASSTFSAWTVAFKALPSMVDTRAKKRLEARKKKKGGDSQFWPKLTGWIEGALEALEPPASLSKAQAATVAKRLREAQKLLLGKAPAAVVPVTKRATSTPIASTAAALEAALQAAEASRFADALEPLRQAWERTRSQPVASLITRFAKLASPGQPRFDEGRTSELHARWMKAGKAFDAALVTPLLAAIIKGSLADAEERLELMLDWPADPRIAECVVERLIFGRDPYIGARPQLWKRAYDLLALSADPRFTDRVRQNAERLENAAAFDRNRAERPHALRTLQPFLDRLAALPELQNDERRLLSALEAAGSKGEATKTASAAPDQALALISAINAAPDDPTPRLVFADFLSERGDPRGEFINLSIALSRGEKVKSALEACAKKLGLHKNSLGDFHLGLRVKGGIDWLRPVPDSEVEAYVSDLGWATVRDLTVKPWDGEVDTPLQRALVERAPLYAVRKLRVSGALAALASKRDFPWLVEHLDLVDAQLPADVAPDAFPHFKRLSLEAWNRIAPPLFEHPLLARVQTITMGQPSTYGPVPIDVLITGGVTLPKLERITVVTSAFDFDAEVSGGKAAMKFVVKAQPFLDDDYFVATLAALRRVPKAVVRSVVVEGEAGPRELRRGTLEAAKGAVAHLA